jgi:hypothetical protein
MVGPQVTGVSFPCCDGLAPPHFWRRHCRSLWLAAWDEGHGSVLLEAALTREHLLQALKRVKANIGAPGVDGLDIDQSAAPHVIAGYIATSGATRERAGRLNSRATRRSSKAAAAR